MEADKLLNTREAAELTGLKPNTLERMRLFGNGPSFIRLGAKAIKYRRSDVLAWIEAMGTHRTTAEYMTTKGEAA